MRLYSYLIVGFALSRIALASCVTETAALASFPVATSPTSYTVTDREHPQFSGSAVLQEDGTLRIAFVTESDQAKSKLPVSDFLPRMLKHFGNKVERVEVVLQQNNTLDESAHEHVIDQELTNFNHGYQDQMRSRAEAERAAAAGLSPDEKQKRFVRGAASATTYGWYVAGANGFGQVTLVDSLGTPGQWVYARLLFEKKPQR